GGGAAVSPGFATSFEIGGKNVVLTFETPSADFAFGLSINETDSILLADLAFSSVFSGAAAVIRAGATFSFAEAAARAGFSAAFAFASSIPKTSTKSCTSASRNPSRLVNPDFTNVVACSSLIGNAADKACAACATFCSTAVVAEVSF